METKETITKFQHTLISAGHAIRGILRQKKGLAAVKLDQTGHKGIPDRLFIEAGGRVMFVEFKNPNGRGVVSDEQRQWAKFIGYKHLFIKSVHDFNRMLKFHFDL